MSELAPQSPTPLADQPLVVLVVDDDPVHTRQVATMLSRWNCGVCTARNGVEALEVLGAGGGGGGPVQLVIADWMMPEMDGLELCRRIRSAASGPYVFTILLTSRDCSGDIVAGLDAGADDYLTKPVHHAELAARIRAARRIIDLQDRLLAVQARLHEEATHDALTGIFNRRAILETLGQELDRVGRRHSSVGVLLVDLDHFKQVNDVHGHLVGDEVLRQTAHRIQAQLRSYDAVGRYGGEEFLVVSPADDGAHAFDLAERVRGAFQQAPIGTSGPAVALTLSVGGVAIPKGADAGMTAVLAAADVALYEAKDGGRNRTVMGHLDPRAEP